MSITKDIARTPTKGVDTKRGVLDRYRHLILSAASGIILALSMPTPEWWVLAWVGLVPLFVALRDATVPRAALCGLVTGLVYYLVFARWLLLFGALPWVVVNTFQALFIALFAILYARFARMRTSRVGLIIVPAAWVAVQFLKTLGAFACPWGSLAHTQANCLPVIQIASVTGAWGIDFMICFVSFAISTAITDRARSKTPLVIAASLVLAMLIFGFVSLREPVVTTGGRRVALLQGNMTSGFHRVPDYLEVAFSLYSRMTLQAAKTNPDIILWPETSLPTDITSPNITRDISKLARQSSSWLLVGGYDPGDDPALDGFYNSLFVFNKDGERAGCYHKAQLVPYGEFVPLRDQMPFLRNYGVRPDDLLASDSHALLDTPIGKLGPSICFESTFSQIARNETRDGAEVLCVVSNDAWFERSSATPQHFMMARLRAVENRRFLLRAASTGVSAVMDPYGRIRHQLGLFREGIIIDRIVPSKTLTLYTRMGDWLAYMCVAVTVICLFVPGGASVKPSRKKRGR